MFVDVTDLRRLETMRRDFVANVSHELRTPIATDPLGGRDAAARGRGRSPRRRPTSSTIIERQAERLQRLVEDLLDLSRIESRQFRLKLEPVRLAPLAEHMLSRFAIAPRHEAHARS